MILFIISPYKEILFCLTVSSNFFTYKLIIKKKSKTVLNELGRLLNRSKELWNNLRPEEGKITREFERKVYFYRNFLLWNSYVVSAIFVVTAQFVKLPPLTANGTERRMLPCA